MKTAASLDVERHNREIRENRQAWARKPVVRRSYASFTDLAVEQNQ